MESRIDEYFLVTSSPSPTMKATNTPKVTEVLSRFCGIPSIGFKFQIPDAWECIQGEDYFLFDSREGILGTGGSHGFGPRQCDGVPGEPGACEVTPYFKNNIISMNLINYQGFDNEIFGGAGKDYLEIVFSIRLDNLENEKMSAEQNEIIRSILESVTFE